MKVLAREYYELTGRPLGVTAEIAEYEAAQLLGLRLSPARQAGYDAIRATGNGEQLLQIKGRCILPGSKPGQRIGAIDLTKQWDTVLLVLLDGEYAPTAIYEADRSAVTQALARPGSRARNERGQLSISKFRAIGRKVWPDR
ncbi:MAG: hypothetical protein M3401_12295 [Actinomycetota bacterium]|nr:hypothetical protein [Actinomycetota bacterium]